MKMFLLLTLLVLKSQYLLLFSLQSLYIYTGHKDTTEWLFLCAQNLCAFLCMEGNVIPTVCFDQP